MSKAKEIRCSVCNNKMKFIDSENGPNMFLCSECGNVVPQWYTDSKKKEKK